MSGHGGAADEPQRIPRSRLADYAAMSAAPAAEPAATSGEPDSGLQETPLAQSAAADPATGPVGPDPAAEEPEMAARRKAFAQLLGEFRRTAVLVPLGDEPGAEEERGMLTADFNGIRFILAFSDEQALARYAQARGEYAREWTYRTVLGARLLDVAVPAAGVPCGVALDCADGADGMVFPPVKGIVPDDVALDRDIDENAGGAA
ncbi:MULTISPECIES: hypothetical protein [unclassified Streptomyces]|uniref:hypothetical protein n=1 Tax=Streptomyces sp. NBC_00120 TaxID=2975660 RepID=UPI00224DD000|nr:MULTISPECIES: hypothetical protein [unclassified Streptomyces]MCX5319629.1 hypothetical protein [Streptomyces sp. NBC_00120]